MSRTVRDPRKPYTVADLMEVTGWSRNTVYAAMQAGTLPGYQSGPGGKYFVPPEAFRALCAGKWRSQPREITVTNISPIRTMTRKAS